MELVGRPVKKSFEGFGTFAGVVESYDPSTGYFQIQYEDGDSEEVDFHEITAILNADGSSPSQPPRRSSRGRRPKKRRLSDPGAVPLGDGSATEDPIPASEIQDNGTNLERKGTPMIAMQGRGLAEESNSCIPESDVGTPNKRQKVSANPKRSACARRRNVRAARSSPDPDICKPEPVIEGPMPTLPPSSTNLDIDGLPVLDVFSVYTCLRSFSRLLFLSPFRLETFIAGLRYRYANSLTDSIHFSILQALKSHLEVLDREGSWSAACCLRNLNWGLLDLVTWPVYLAEYMLVRGQAMRPGFKLASFQLLNGEYYKQRAEVKLEILRCLCDDVIEVEAIRSELNRRMVEPEPNADGNRNMHVSKKLEDSTTADLGSSTLAQEVVEDGNFDECCLCRMDGNLICCDGCPAAFHSKCVGVAKDLLPEGDWFCPECSMEKDDGLGKLSRPFRGADILGADPHGRIYFGSCSYLLVSDSFDTDTTYHYYNKNDLDTVIKGLISSSASYNVIVNAISMYWGIPTEASCSSSHFGNGISHIHEDAHLFSRPLSPSKHDVVTSDIIKKRSKENIAFPDNFGLESSNVSDIVQLNLMTSNQLAGTTCPVATSEIPGEMNQAANCIDISQQSGTDCSVDSSFLLSEATSLKSNILAIEQEKYIGFSGWGCMSWSTKQRRIGISQLEYDPTGYVNYYCFGRIASSVSEELLKASSESNNREIIKSVEDIKSLQLKAISRKSIKSWYAYQKLAIYAKKEKCGWCFPCQTSSGCDCLFEDAGNKPLEGTKKQKIGLRSEKNRKSHLGCATHHILSIEDRVRSLLSGPWEDPHYSTIWRKAVMKAPDVASLKELLLVLESNLRRVALSSEWLKPVHSAHMIGPDSHTLTSSFHALPRPGGSKRLARKPLSAGFLFDHHTSTASDIYWWRGGRLSRQVFQWKMLPRPLAYKSGRQAGCRKIPSILYPESSEPNSSKWIAWRAAVEMSRSVAQLICQVKDFESNIRWSELSNTQLFPQMFKEVKKSIRPLKKVIVRRKCIEGTLVKYLLDFGKRGTIPAIVSKHGVILEESSNERRKYWLSETHVPLSLVKAFEEKKLARISKKTNSGLLSEKGSISCKKSKPSRMKGLSHLLSREPKSQLCGHCNKDVLIREAVNCQHCCGYFHKNHCSVPRGVIATTYMCHGCKDKTNVKEKTQCHKVSKRKKMPNGKKLQEVSKKRKLVLVKSKKNNTGLKRNNQAKSKKKLSNLIEDEVSWHTRRRTILHHSYWRNGLLWSCKPADERGNHFKEKKVVLPFQHIEDPLMPPICCLCHENYNPEVIYICCESCEDWFHGDVFDLTLENINNLISFKCHKCRMKSIPTCRYSVKAAVTECRAESETMGVNHQRDEGMVQAGASEEHPSIVHSEDPLDEERREDDHTRPSNELIFYCKHSSTDGDIDIEPVSCTEEQMTSTKHENGVQMTIEPQEMGKGLAIPELLVTGTLGDSAEPRSRTILSEPHLVNIEGGKT